MTTTTVKKETHKSRGRIPASCEQTRQSPELLPGPAAGRSLFALPKKNTQPTPPSKRFLKNELKKKAQKFTPQLKAIWARHSCDLQSKVEQNSEVRSTTINTRQRRQPAPPPPPSETRSEILWNHLSAPATSRALQSVRFPREFIAQANPPARHHTSSEEQN